MFLDVVKRAREKYKLTIHNFCILGQPFHMILKPGEKESLSRIMQWILSVFAMKYSRAFNIIGHVFYDRFKSVIINDFRQYVATFIYTLFKLQLEATKLQYIHGKSCKGKNRGKTAGF